MKLGALFQGIPVVRKIHWDSNRVIKKITCDSRAIEAGDVFIACQGVRMDGHDFLGQAILAKASVIVYENEPELVIPPRVTAIQVRDSRACLTQILGRYYGYPDRRMKLSGVTGTNGKTTIAYLLHRLLGEKTPSAYLGTLWYEFLGRREPAHNTTPPSEILIPLLDEISRHRTEHCVMEVSSHALDQRRVFGLQYELAIFTQLTQDHLDYHKDMERYFQAKRKFFIEAPTPVSALINRDCPFGRRLISEVRGAKTYSVLEDADYRAVDIHPSFQGSHFKLRTGSREIPFQIRLPMLHNVINTVAVLGALDLLGYDIADFRGALQEIPGIPGRMERVGQQQDFQIFVDYAHTPDAIENVLSQARKLSPSRILTLFGCGGDRDQSKRPLMARSAARWSDILVVTSDNPRSEDPELILEDIRRGLPSDGSGPAVYEISDREEAIDKLLSLAEPGDALFVLGKGHEDYQILGERKIPFDDRLVIQKCLQRKHRVFLP
ncbi:MAG: UDP-N-acetylmuramoyl-L-alanyl-D-glutamate--2,6-diaminopimelate ligase [Candidatus Omnitrophota bacterium]|jgi:UDP-N-acetylmuramoyl-L-alanyl-D-glutamate--2,6-diaminopimelate ligase